MKKRYHPIAVLTLVALFFTSTPKLSAEEQFVDAGGKAYESSYQASRVAPAIALALAVIAGAIAVGVQNRSHSHHGHNHSHSD